jgi:hypothetical protein
MDENSEKMPIIPEKEPTIPEKEPTIPEKGPIITEQTPEPPPQPKARGRPKGVRDAKPRIKRVPIQQEEDEAPPPRVKAKKVEVRQEEKPPPEPEEPPPAEEEESEEEPPPPKSPRTLHRERMQHAAAERQQLARDRQDRFERILDNFMGF